MAKALKNLPAGVAVAGAMFAAIFLGPYLMAATETPEPGEETTEMTNNHELATFGAGCFWGVEAAFRRTEGVVDTQVGYMGGDVENPTYEQVCTGKSGHAEVVEVTFDPEKVSYEALVALFWTLHDPTQVNRQGPDIGTQYRSAIFHHNDAQRDTAEALKKQQDASGKHRAPIATEIVAAGAFWRAEEYHQRYLEKRGLASCATR